MTRAAENVGGFKPTKRNLYCLRTGGWIELADGWRFLFGGSGKEAIKFAEMGIINGDGFTELGSKLRDEYGRSSKTFLDRKPAIAKAQGDGQCPRAPIGQGVGAPRYWTDWHEDIGSVLWWKWPSEELPYVGTPLDLGHVVELDLEVRSSCGNSTVGKHRMHVGGWPFGDEDSEERECLWWTPLPDCEALDRAIRDEISSPLGDQP